MDLHPPRDDEPPGLVDTISGSQASSLWGQYNGDPIDDNFVGGVRTRAWETAVPAGSVNSIAKSPPPDHSGVMTWAYG